MGGIRNVSRHVINNLKNAAHKTSTNYFARPYIRLQIPMSEGMLLLGALVSIKS